MTAKPVRAALYLRVSTDTQTTDNQRQALEAEAARRGWDVVRVYEDAGISGAKSREKRPGLDSALTDATKGRYDVLMSWAVDRLGRSTQDLISTLRELHGADVDLFLHQQGLDTRTPAGRAMYGMLSVFAEFERAMIQARVHAGLDKRRKAGKRFGRPVLGMGRDEDKRRKGMKQRADAERMLKDGASATSVVKATGLGAGTVIKIREELKALGKLRAAA